MTPIDLRSDTVTKPTEGMRRAMGQAEVGDDVYGEDPTVNRLQACAAELYGKAAALFVPSGSMGNQVAVAAHTQKGQEVIGDAACHIFNYEMGALAAYSGVMARMVPTPRGFLSAADVAAHHHPKGGHTTPTGLVVVENTHNLKGGGIYPAKQLAETAKAARERGLPVHMDGARSPNAAVASGVSPAELVREVDSVMFCFSKGLGAPVGSIVVGSKDFIVEAYTHRKRLGGGMRQAGVLAAACLYALDHHYDRLAEDHANARLLAKTLAELGMDVDPVETNIVFFNTPQPNAPQAVRALEERGVRCLALGPSRMRLVTHLDVSAEQTKQACEALKRVLGESSISMME